MDQDREVNLDEKQLEFVNSPVQSCSVIGVPGCGKSTTIAKYVIEKKTQGILNDKEILCILFGKPAQLSLLKKMDGYNMFEYVRTFDSLCREFLKKNKIYDMKNNYDRLNDEAKNEIHNEIRRKCGIFMNDPNTNMNFWNELKLVIVDEAQDINSNDFNIINCFKKKLSNLNLILIGDPNQCIYSEMRLSNEKYLLTHNKKVYTLENNYRSSHEIVTFAAYFQNNKTKIVCSSGVHGPLPKYIKSDCYDSSNKHIINFINEKIINGKSPGKIAILTKLRIQNTNFAKLLKKENIKYNNFNNDIKNPKDGINLMTYWKAKGLEWDIVVLYDFHDWNRSKRDFLNCIKFEGVTRPKSELCIYYNSKSKTPSRYNDDFIPNKECSIINTIPEYLYEKIEI